MEYVEIFFILFKWREFYRVKYKAISDNTLINIFNINIEKIHILDILVPENGEKKINQIVGDTDEIFSDSLIN